MNRTVLGLSPMGYRFAPPDDPILFEWELREYLFARLDAETFFGFIPQGVQAWPVLVLNVIDSDPVADLSGPAGLAAIRVQLDSYSPSEAEAFRLSRRLWDVLAGYRGPIGKAVVQGVSRTRLMTSRTANADGSDRGLYRSLSEWNFWWNEPRPKRST